MIWATAFLLFLRWWVLSLVSSFSLGPAVVSNCGPVHRVQFALPILDPIGPDIQFCTRCISAAFFVKYVVLDPLIDDDDVTREPTIGLSMRRTSLVCLCEAQSASLQWRSNCGTKRQNKGRSTMKLGAAIAIAAWLALGVTATHAQTVRLGVINTYSGPSANLGEQIDRGIRLYVKQHGKDLPPGVKLEIIRRDDTGPNPEVAKRMAQELITRDHVRLLAGPVYSPNALAIAPVVTEGKVPFIILNAGTAV